MALVDSSRSILPDHYFRHHIDLLHREKAQKAARVDDGSAPIANEPSRLSTAAAHWARHVSAGTPGTATVHAAHAAAVILADACPTTCYVSTATHGAIAATTGR